MPVLKKNWTVTISRQMGSNSRETAAILGEILGYRFVWREILNLAARQAGAPEAALAAIDEFGLLGFYLSIGECQAYRTALDQVIGELAENGKVIILGRAGQTILAGRPDVLHIRLVAPISVRIQRIAERSRIPIAAAQAQVEASDKFRRGYLKKVYQVDWNAAELYDLVINTARFAPRMAAELILQALCIRDET